MDCEHGGIIQLPKKARFAMAAASAFMGVPRLAVENCSLCTSFIGYSARQDFLPQEREHYATVCTFGAPGIRADSLLMSIAWLQPLC